MASKQLWLLHSSAVSLFLPLWSIVKPLGSDVRSLGRLTELWGNCLCSRGGAGSGYVPGGHHDMDHMYAARLPEASGETVVWAHAVSREGWLLLLCEDSWLQQCQGAVAWQRRITSVKCFNITRQQLLPEKILLIRSVIFFNSILPNVLCGCSYAKEKVIALATIAYFILFEEGIGMPYLT